jgi:thiol-disulfide isomerase/thioredoxin
MKTKTAALAFFVLWCAGPAAASLLTGPVPTTAAVGEELAFKVLAGYHFNLKAPQECGDAEAFAVSKEEVKCRFAAAGEQAVSLKICDDKETACMFEDFTVLVGGAGPARPAAAVEGEGDTGLEGFLLNVPDEALALAKKEGKLLFIDFFGRWCPPCRVMEDTVLTQAAFLEATAGMVRVSLDVDRPASRAWRKRFRPSGYPTYLIADADLNEIGRWAGSGNLTAFSAWVKEQERWKDQPIEQAKARVASLDATGRLRVAKEYMGAEKWAEARKALAGLETRTAAYLDAQARVQAPESTAPVKMAELYQGLIERFDGRDGQDAEGAVLDWIGALHKLDPAAAKPYVAGLDATLERLKRSKDAESEGYDATDILYQAAVAMGDAGLGELSKDLYGRAAGAYAEMAAKAARPDLAKGLRMSQARCLMGARRPGEAAAVYGGLVNNYPEEYAFHRSYAGALLELKDYPAALREASLAARLSYGDIHAGIVILKARIQLAQKDKPGAVKTLNDALAELAGSKSEARGASDLKDYLEKITASN